MRWRKNLIWMSLITLILLLFTPFTLISLWIIPIQLAYATPDPTNETYIDPPNIINDTLTPHALAIRPTGDGTFTDWTGAYTNWDDYPHDDGDTTYVSTASVGMRESSNLEDHTTESWTIARVKVVIVARGATWSKVKPILVIGGTSFFGVSYNLTTTYATYTSEWGKNPDTGDYWTWTDIDALEAGVYSEVAGETGEIRVTQLYVKVSGSRFTVDIRVDDVEDLWAFQFEVSFNPDVIQGVYPDEAAEDPFELGPFLESAGGTAIIVPGAGWKNTVGRLGLAGALLLLTDPDLCPDGGGVLATVTFDVVGRGESEIRLGEDTGLKDYTGAWLAHGRDYVEDGYFRNMEKGLIPTASFTATPVSTPLAEGPLEGYNTQFDGTPSTAASGRTIQTYKWYFWETVRNTMYGFPTSSFSPNGDGAYTDWTGAYTDWDDYPSGDGDHTYIKAASGDLYESSTLEDHTTETWPIREIRVTIQAKTDVVTDEKVRLMIVVGGTPYFGTEHSLTGVYSACTSEWSINPRYRTAWNWSAIDNLEAGVVSEQVGDTWTGEIRITQLYVEVIPDPIVTSTPTQSWDTVTWNYTRRGKWNVTLTVIDDQGAVGTIRSLIEVKAHDVSITEIKTNTHITRTTYLQFNHTDVGDVMQINVTAGNQGHFTETFNVTCFWSAEQATETHNGTIGTQYGITLAAGANTILIFYWDTEEYVLTHPNTYIIHANASRVPYEYDIEWATGKTAPNEFKCGDPHRIRSHDIAVTDIGLFNYLLLRPDGDGNKTDWTGDYTDWDDETPDGDSTYVSATEKDLSESSTLEDHTTETWHIEKVNVTAVARTTTKTTTDRLQLILVVEETPYTSSIEHILTTTYSGYTSEWTKNPATDSDWTWSDIDNLEAGVRTWARFGWTTEARVTQLYVEVFATLTAPVVGEETVQVAVTITNEGDFNETSISVTAYYDKEPIGAPQTIELLTNKTFSDEEYIGMNTYTVRLGFNWDTTGVSDGAYRISAKADVVPDEYDTVDNTLVDGVVRWPEMPEASFTYSPSEPLVDEPVAFNASASNDLEGAIVSYEWDFGDGETDSGVTVNHPFSLAESYNVTLTVSDGVNSDTEEKTIIVSPVPNIAVTDVTASPAYPPDQVTVGDYVTISVDVLNEGDLEEILSIDVYYDSAPVERRSGVSLSGGATKTLTFIWNTIGVYPATYTINATVPPVPSEEAAEDNTASFSSVSFVTPPDETPPSIGTPSREPAGDVMVDQEVTVLVVVTDEESGVKNVTLSYTTTNGTSWSDLPMTYNSTSGFYQATIPGQSYCTWVKYKIIAYDNAENPAVEDNGEAYYVYHIIPEFPSIIIVPLLMVLTIIAAVSRVLLRRPSRTRRVNHS